MNQSPNSNNWDKKNSALPEQNDKTCNYPEFSLEIVKFPLAIAIICPLILVVFIVIGFMTRDDQELVPSYKKRVPIVPIFLALYEKDGNVVFVNESDLGVKALDLSDDQGFAPTAEIFPNKSGLVMLHQPRGSSENSVSLKNLNLDPLRIKQALESGRDKSHLFNNHSKEPLALPNGETAIWIQVHHSWMFNDYWNGLLYVIRKNAPVILLKISYAKDFEIADLNKDGFKEISYMDTVWDLTKSVSVPRWHQYLWDGKTASFSKQPNNKNLFTFRHSIGSVLQLFIYALPFILVLLLSLRVNIVRMKILVNLYFILNVVYFVLPRVLDNSVKLPWAILLLIFQYCLIAMAFKRFKLLKF